MPPQLATKSWPMICVISQSPPLTRISGFTALISSYGVSSSNTNTASTKRRLSNNSFRSFCGTIGLSGPLSRFIEASLLSPTTRKSPRARAPRRVARCPMWTMSKQPLVKTIFLSACLWLCLSVLRAALRDSEMWV